MAFTPGAAECLANAAKLVADTTNKADGLRTDYSAKVVNVENQFPTVASLIADIDIAAGTSTVPSVVEPAVVIPATIDVTDITDTFKTEYDELVALLADKLTGFLTTYFPNDKVDYAAAESFLIDSLASDSGIPAAVQAQILTEDKDRILAEAARASDSVVQSFASRRFPMPPGAAASAVLHIQQKSQDEIASSARKITVLSVERLQWAAEKVLGLRQLASTQAIEYIKALASGPDIASRVTGIGYDAQSKLIGAASQFYAARTDVARLTAQNNQFNVDKALEADSKNQAADLAIVEDKIKMMLTEAQGLAQMATSLYNNLHASAGTSYSVSISESSSV